MKPLNLLYTSSAGAPDSRRMALDLASALANAAWASP